MPDAADDRFAADDPALAAVLAEVLEPAFVVARRDGDAAPRALQPFLRFDRVNERVLQRVVVALVADAGFRARVLEVVGEDDEVVGRGAVLFLARPEGWAEELDALLDGERARLAEASSRAEEEQATATVARLEAALAAARASTTDLERRLDQAITERDSALALRDEAQTSAALAAIRMADLFDERARAVKDLAEARQLAERRLAQIRSLEAAAPGDPAAADGDDGADRSAEAATTDGRDARAAAGREAALDALREVASVVGRLTAEVGSVLDEAMGALGAPTPGAVPDAVPPAASADDGPRPALAPAAPRAARRTAVRLRHGAVDGTPEATAQLLGLDDVLVLVDGYNVSQTGWHHLSAADQRQALLGALGDLRARTGADFHVVFDGDDSGARPSVSVALPVRVYFTVASEEADDAILRMVTEIPLDRPVVVVSSDHRVRDGARRRGANVVGSAELLAALRH